MLQGLIPAAHSLALLTSSPDHLGSFLFFTARVLIILFQMPRVKEMRGTTKEMIFIQVPATGRAFINTEGRLREKEEGPGVLQRQETPGGEWTSLI